ncbi:integrin alpha-E [Nycticebus coucang]|uniref:integrin alpha-E n=1 Tax=Nycticebus coucang TaxID=9470 RepID=UPI00234D473E|nr:integrin alpha-E [Nycticebus coucang]
MWCLHTLLCVASLASVMAFNVDVAWPWVTPEGGAPFVLSSLLHQDPRTNQTWLLITSPRTNRTSRPLHRCSLIQDKILCQPVEHVHIPKGRYQGVTVVRNHHTVLVCIQVPARQPHSLSSELTGTCSLLDPDLHLQAQANFLDLESILDLGIHVDGGACHRNKEGSMGEHEITARQRRALEEPEEEEEEEDETGTEIAIILDGSGSIDPPDFQRAKDFISNMMKNFYEKCFECSFALVQYGEVIQTEFDLRDSQDMTATLARVQNIIQVGNLTRTASAMQHVLDNIFTPSHGSRKKASKVMVVLTDGDIFEDPLNLTTVINSPKMQGVERFAIGVGEAFSKAKTYRELKLIASDPDETHAFKVTNYSALDGLLSKLQHNIIRMEGAVGDALHYQLAQVGFSAQILDKGQVLLGAVGAFDWSGGALLYNTYTGQGRFLNQTAVAGAEAAQYGYLGYAVAVLHKACGLSYVAGAPRHKQRGAVFELQKESGEASFLPTLEGEQMGSYFGSELCPVDIDMDGTTDFLLVAAPFYHIHREEGRVYVYRLNEQDGSFSLAHTLSGHPGFIDARFGFAMATVGDISQDQLTDVAIGAPLEGFGADDGASFGSVYIYNGRWGGLSASPSQRIQASTVSPGLYYFGTSVAGGLDFSGDGLPDITVGTLGRAAVLRSQPVVRLWVSMTFTPRALPIGFNSSVNVHLCFEVSSATTATESGLRETSLNFTLDVDVGKKRKRLQCSDMKACLSSLREWSSGSHLCEHLLLVRTEGELCEEDCFSNISIKVSYQLQTPKGRRGHPRPILDQYTEPSAIFQLPYEKDCKNKLFCVAELQLATTISQQELVVGLTKELTMNINLTNAGEDSYMTSMALNYPRNLQFKRIQKPPSPNVQCDDPQLVASILVMNCKIGHPILKQSSANVSVVWQLEENTFPNRTADITVTVTNSNERRSLARETHSLQFRHAFTAVLSKPLVMYMNTSQKLSEHKEFPITIHGENLFGAEFQLQICVPVKLLGLQIVKVKNLMKTQGLGARRGRGAEQGGTGAQLVAVCGPAAHAEVRTEVVRAAAGEGQRSQLAVGCAALLRGPRSRTRASWAHDQIGPKSQPQTSWGSGQARLVFGDSATRARPPSTDRAAREVRVGRIVGNDRLREAAAAGLAAAKETLLVLRREPLRGFPHRVPPRPTAARSPVRSEEPTAWSREWSRHGWHPPSSSNASTARLARKAYAPHLRSLGPSARPYACASRSGRLGAGSGAKNPGGLVCSSWSGEYLSFQTHTVCTRREALTCGNSPVRHVEEWHSVNCTIASDKENVTVAAEITLDHAKQLLRDITELQILGEITFNSSLYEGLNAENHRTKITVIFLKDEEYRSLPVIIGSSVGGLLVLIVIIVILFKCGFFRRKYKQLNLESIRKAQMKSEDLLIED